MLINHFMPMYDFREIHSCTISTSPERVWETIKTITPKQVKFLRILFQIRALPGRLMGKRSAPFSENQAILKQALNGGFLLLGENNRELVLGTVGQFWRLIHGTCNHISSPEAFMQFEDLKYAKAVINFRIEQISPSSVKVMTETRIRIPNPTVRKKFFLYWILVRPGSALLRKSILQAIKQQAEIMK